MMISDQFVKILFSKTKLKKYLDSVVIIHDGVKGL